MSWGMYPHHHMLGQPWWWRICCEKPELDLLRQQSLAQVGQYFFMGDILWESV